MLNQAEIKQQFTRTASRMLVGGEPPEEQVLHSWFGRVEYALPDEDWPRSQYDDIPMQPLCQLVCADLSYRPSVLDGVELVTIFISIDDLLPMPMSYSGDNWIIRGYSSLDELIAIEPPEDLELTIKPQPIRWRGVEEDYPSWEDFLTLIPDASEDTQDQYLATFENHYFSKVGGWPSLIERESFRPLPMGQVEFVIQIDTEASAGWEWGDGGTGHFGIDWDKNEWILDWQSY
jgi:hypothetical protein